MTSGKVTLLSQSINLQLHEHTNHGVLITTLTISHGPLLRSPDLAQDQSLVTNSICSHLPQIPSLLCPRVLSIAAAKVADPHVSGDFPRRHYFGCVRGLQVPQICYLQVNDRFICTILVRSPRPVFRAEMEDSEFVNMQDWLCKIQRLDHKHLFSAQECTHIKLIVRPETFGEFRKDTLN